MRIDFERIGGFAGIRLKADVDTDALSQEEAKSWQALVENAQLGQIRQSSGADSRTRDAFEYWLTVEDGAKRSSVRMTDETLPPSATPLIDRLLALAKKPKPSS
jgi:Emfourin